MKPTVPDRAVEETRRLTQEISRLREAEEDTLDHRERQHLADQRMQKERELADLPTPEPLAVARAPLPVNGTQPPSNAGGNDADEVKVELHSEAPAIAESDEPKPTEGASVASAGKGKGNDAQGGTAVSMPSATGLPVISTYERPTRDIAADAYRALLGANNPPWAYVHSGALMKLRVSADGRARIEPITFDMLSCRMHEIADFHGNHGMQRTAPQAVVKYVLNIDAHHGLPMLTGVVNTPVLRPDGTVLSRSGYDPKSGLFLSATLGLNVLGIPDAPTRDDVFRARDFLLDFIAEFPFVGAADKANFLAAWMTPIIRPILTGCLPLVIFDKPTPSSGATTLGKIIKATADGSVAVNGLPLKDEELEKRITAMLQNGTAVVIFDNVDYPLGSAELSRLLTSQEWEGRILGVSKMVCLPNFTLWTVTGNNVLLAGDVPRRAVAVRVDARMPHPEDRRDFKHQLPDDILEQRGAVIVALLTMARGWFVAGCPNGPGVRADNFASWARTCGGILAYAEVPGFLTNLHEVRHNAEDGRAEWGVFIEALHRRFGSEPFTAAKVTDLMAGYSDLVEVAPPDVRKAMGREDFTQALGHLFRTQRDKVFNASDSRRLRFIRDEENDRTNVALWRVLVIEGATKEHEA